MPNLRNSFEAKNSPIGGRKVLQTGTYAEIFRGVRKFTTKRNNFSRTIINDEGLFTYIEIDQRDMREDVS